MDEKKAIEIVLSLANYEEVRESEKAPEGELSKGKRPNPFEVGNAIMYLGMPRSYALYVARRSKGNEYDPYDNTTTKYRVVHYKPKDEKMAKRSEEDDEYNEYDDDDEDFDELEEADDDDDELEDDDSDELEEGEGNSTALEKYRR